MYPWLVNQDPIAVDDLVDLYGQKGRARPGNDIAEGKVSALVVHHVALQPSHSGWMRQVLGTPRDRRLSPVLQFRICGG